MSAAEAAPADTRRWSQSLRVLPWATCGADVVPGVPSRVRRLADELDEVARGLSVMRGLVDRVPSTDWCGPASAACSLVVGQQPERYVAAVQAMSSAASALRSHAAVLDVVQQRADGAVRLDAVAADATHRWLTAAPATEHRTVGAGTDPGAAARHRVQEEVEAARQQLAASAASTVECLRRGAGRAPERPVLALRAARSALGFGRDVGHGVVETLADTSALAVRLDPNRAWRDPWGFWPDAWRTVGDVGEAVRNPTELIEAVADVDTLHASPGRWVGHLLPDVALAVGTAGALPVAERSATVAARVAARVGPRSVRGPLADAIEAQVGTGRGPLRLSDVRPYRTPPDVAGHRTSVGPVDNAVGRRVARDSRWAERDITPRVRAVADELRVSWGTNDERIGLRGVDHVLKGSDSLLRKLASESADTGVPVPRLAPQLNDTVRYTITVPHGSYVGGAFDTVAGMERRGLRLTAAKSFWGGERYQGLNLTFHDARTGRPIEVQVHTPASWQATVDSHVDYEWFRSKAIGPVLREFFRRRIAARFAPVPLPDDVDRLGHLLTVGDAARMTTPELHSVPRVTGAAGFSTGVHSIRSLACHDDD